MTKLFLATGHFFVSRPNEELQMYQDVLMAWTDIEKDPVLMAAVRWYVVQCVVAVCCSVLQCVAVVAVCCSVVQCVAVCCSVL